MCFFKRHKYNAVVIKRTPDIVPYKIFSLSDKSNLPEANLGHFASPIFGKDVKDDAFATRKSNTPSSAYDPFRSEPRKEVTNDDPYPEFRKVPGTKKPEPVKTEPVVEEKKEEAAMPAPEIKPEEPTKVFHYEDSENGTKTVDPSLVSALFGPEPVEVKTEPVEEKKEEKPVTIKNNQENELTEEQQKALNDAPKMASYKGYTLPSLSLLDEVKVEQANAQDKVWNENNIAIINKTLADFKIDGQVHEFTVGPTFTRYAIILGSGVSGSKIENLQSDIQRSLSATSIRIENPIPGKSYVGIEVPNQMRRTVHLRELLSTEEFMNSKDPLLVPVGLDVEGKARYTSISDFPHGLVAGASGSGKSVYLACMITSLLYRDTPEDLRFFFIDPKKVDLQQFRDIPHLIAPIVDDVKEGINSFKWLINEMERRFTLFNMIGGITKLKEYNEYCKTNPQYKKLPYIVCVIEEAGDFLMSGGAEAQDLITRLVQKSRAAGIHIILAMQKPVAKVLSTTIKSNASARFAFHVSSPIDSITIIDSVGGDKLLGNGDMMFYLSGIIERYQSGFVSPKETTRVREFVASQAPINYLFIPSELDKKQSNNEGTSVDDLFAQVARYVVNNGKCSMNAISQDFGIGFNRANAIVESLEHYGIVSENLGTKPRQVLVTPEDIDDKLRQIGA